MRARWIGAALPGLCAMLVLTPQAHASPLVYSVVVSGTGTATYSTSSDDPSVQPSKGSGPATFTASAQSNFGTLTGISIDVPGSDVGISVDGDNFNGQAVATGVSRAGVGPIYIEALNGDVGFGTSYAFGEVTLTPTSVTSRIEGGDLIYTIASGTGVGDATLVSQEENLDPGGDPPFFTYETDIQLDITALTGTVYISGVPLPGSAPMLGGALFTIGLVGRAWKQRSHRRSQNS